MKRQLVFRVFAGFGLAAVMVIGWGQGHGVEALSGLTGSIPLIGLAISHMALLIVFAAWARRGDPGFDYGPRIAITGYVHTLIGVGLALVALGNVQTTDATDWINEIRGMVGPIGVALSTSIIGWWAGSEIGIGDERRGSTDAGVELSRTIHDIHDTVTKLKYVVDGMAGLGASLAAASVAVAKLGPEADKIRTSLSDVNNTVQGTKVTFASIQTELTNMKSSAASAAESTRTLAVNADQLAKRFQEGAGKIAEVDEIITRLRRGSSPAVDAEAKGERRTEV